MAFRIDHELVNVQEFPIVGKQEVQIFECFAQEKRLHHVARLHVLGIVNVADRRVAVFDLGVFFYALKGERIKSLKNSGFGAFFGKMR